MTDPTATTGDVAPAEKAETKVDDVKKAAPEVKDDIEEAKEKSSAAAATGDKPTNSVILLATVGIFLAAFIAATVLTGLSAGNLLPSTEMRRDLGKDYKFDTLPFQVPFPFILGAFASAVLGIAVLALYAFDVLRKDVGNPRMVEIAGYIQEGSMAFLHTEYTYLGGLCVILFVLLGFAQNWSSAGCYAIGAILSAATGYFGMMIATRGNVRTTAACINGISQGLNVAFRAGAVMGLSVVAVGLAGLSFCYLVFRDVRALAGFSAGASTIALFARVGGGIYTKAADVGADLVGKVEANIPEDDPRNPATIADNVGDNVGDVAGMGSDLFESYVGSIVATAILGASLPYYYQNPRAMCIYNHLHIDAACPAIDSTTGQPRSLAVDLCVGSTLARYPSLTTWQSNSLFIALPFMLALVGILVSILCTVYVYVKKGLSVDDRAKVMESLLFSLRINIYSASFLVTLGAIGLCWGLFGPLSHFGAVSGFNTNNAYYRWDFPVINGVRNISCALSESIMNAPPGLFPRIVREEASYIPREPLGFTFPEPRQIAWRLFLCIVIGLILGNLIGALTEYFTAGSFAPTRGIAESGEYGAGAVVIQGLGVGMLSTTIPIILVVTSIVGAYNLFGSYGIALAAVGMLSTLGVTMATDAYGPVADNAGGIAEMAELDGSVRDTTDALDALGNTTAATGKGFSNGSAVLTAYALLTAVVQDSGLAPNPIQLTQPANSAPPRFTISSYQGISVVDIYVVVSLFIGLALPFLFGAFTMLAVSRAAQAMIVEVRRQFREISGLREGLPGVRPDHTKCIRISTTSSISEMVLPGVLAIMTPLIIGFGFGQRALVAMLVAAIGSGYMLGIMMSNAGGAWDNAKKLVESGAFGGDKAKGSDLHKATVAGDTVGDPFKDTSGPSMNILIKLMTTFGLVTVSLMNPGLDDPTKTTGWIGIILFVVTLIFVCVWGYLTAKWSSDARRAAMDKGEAGDDGKEDKPLLEKTETTADAGDAKKVE